MLIIDNDLQMRVDWQLETGPGINPVPADLFVGFHSTDQFLRVTNVSTLQYGGALLTCKRQVPLVFPGMEKLFYAALYLEFMLSKFDFENLWAHETDLKAVVQGAPNAATKIPNVFDWSAQVNIGRGGMFQIDQVGGGWIDTGIKIPPVPDVWNALEIFFKADVTSSKFSVTGVTSNGSHYNVPTGLQNVPLLSSNWQPVAAVQLQNEVSKPGVVNITYRKVNLLYSPDPIKV